MYVIIGARRKASTVGAKSEEPLLIGRIGRRIWGGVANAAAPRRRLRAGAGGGAPKLDRVEFGQGFERRPTGLGLRVFRNVSRNI